MLKWQVLVKGKENGNFAGVLANPGHPLWLQIIIGKGTMDSVKIESSGKLVMNKTGN